MVEIKNVMVVDWDKDSDGVVSVTLDVEHLSYHISKIPYVHLVDFLRCLNKNVKAVQGSSLFSILHEME